MFRHVFFSAPHRLMFAGGTVQILVAMLLWAWELQARHFSLLPVPTWPWPPTWVHGGLMVFGIFPWFIFGFLMTALPKWMAAPALSRRQYIPAFCCKASGWLLTGLGYFLPLLMPAGLLLVALGWAWGVVALGQATRGSFNDRSHAYAVLAALALGWLGLLAYAVALGRVDAVWFRLAIAVGLWGGLLPTFFIVLHRMLPFFTGAMVRGYQGYQPPGALWGMLVALLGHGLLAAAEVDAWRWLPDLAAAGIAAHLSWRWGLRASLGFPMVAMLHLGVLWLVLGLASYTLQDFLALAGFAWGGLLPLHAIGAGFFGSILIGMATRVTLGHSGRPIASDRWAWRLFLVYQGVVVLRLAGEFSPLCNLAAAVGWLAVFGGWAAVHLPMYLKPRPDGQPG